MSHVYANEKSRLFLVNSELHNDASKIRNIFQGFGYSPF